MQSEPQLERQMNNRNRSLGDVLRIENADIITEHVQVVQQSNNIAIPLPRASGPGDKRRFLKRRTRPSPKCIRDRLIPGEVADSIEQSSGGRPAELGVVRF